MNKWGDILNIPDNDLLNNPEQQDTYTINYYGGHTIDKLIKKYLSEYKRNDKNDKNYNNKIEDDKIIDTIDKINTKDKLIEYNNEVSKFPDHKGVNIIDVDDQTGEANLACLGCTMWDVDNKKIPSKEITEQEFDDDICNVYEKYFYDKIDVCFDTQNRIDAFSKFIHLVPDISSEDCNHNDIEQ